MLRPGGLRSLNADRKGNLVALLLTGLAVTCLCWAPRSVLLAWLLGCDVQGTFMTTGKVSVQRACGSAPSD